MPTEVLTGVGRIVWGHPMRAQEKKYMDGPNKGQTVLGKDGQPVVQWSFGVAFPKAEFGPIWQAMEAEARTGYPHGVPQRFSWKYKDGDGIDGNGKPFADREGHPGCYVLTVTTEAFCPPCYIFENGQYRQLVEKEIKCGDHVALKLSLKVNVATGTNTPSLYVNPVAVQLVGYGKEIVNSGVNPNDAFGGRQFALPPGASATPISSAPAGVGMPMGQPPGQPPQQYGAQPVYMQQPPAAPGYPQAPQQPQYGAPPPMPDQAPPPMGYPPQQPAPGGYAPPPMPGQMPGR